MSGNITLRLVDVGHPDVAHLPLRHHRHQVEKSYKKDNDFKKRKFLQKIVSTTSAATTFENRLKSL